MLGSHNMLTSSLQSAEREVGIRTTDLNIIQGLINRFDGACVQDVQKTSCKLSGLAALIVVQSGNQVASQTEAASPVAVAFSQDSEDF